VPIVLPWLLACTPEPPDAGPEVWSTPVAHHDDGFLFDVGRINRIDLTLSADAEEILRRERVFTQPRNEVRGTATLDGEEVGEIGVRLRGGGGSFQRYDDKPKWELDFNEYTGERFHGLESLSLNNHARECAGANDHFAFYATGLAGVPTSRSGHVQLFVNGLDYGLYVALETPDDRWLKRNYANNDGNLYDGGYVQIGTWPIMPLDFGVGRDHLFDLEEGVDVGAADVAAISAELEQPGVSDALWALIDWERMVRKWAVEQWSQNEDAYVPASNNFRVYFQTDGPMVMSPWDQDTTFSLPDPDGDNPLGDRRYQEPGGSLAIACNQDADCRALWRDAALDVADVLEDPAVSTWIADLLAVTREGLDGDPRGDCTVEDRDAQRTVLEQWPPGASARLRASWE